MEVRSFLSVFPADIQLQLFRILGLKETLRLTATCNALRERLQGLLRHLSRHKELCSSYKSSVFGSAAEESTRDQRRCLHLGHSWMGAPASALNMWNAIMGPFDSLHVSSEYLGRANPYELGSFLSKLDFKVAELTICISDSQDESGMPRSDYTQYDNNYMVKKRSVYTDSYRMPEDAERTVYLPAEGSMTLQLIAEAPERYCRGAKVKTRVIDYLTVMLGESLTDARLDLVLIIDTLLVSSVRALWNFPGGAIERASSLQLILHTKFFSSYFVQDDLDEKVRYSVFFGGLMPSDWRLGTVKSLYIRVDLLAALEAVCMNLSASYGFMQHFGTSCSIVYRNERDRSSQAEARQIICDFQRELAAAAGAVNGKNTMLWSVTEEKGSLKISISFARQCKLSQD